jgi:hypothetical protein
VEAVIAAPTKVQQVAELVEQPVEIREYRRPLCQCTDCGWSGYSQLPVGVLEGFSAVWMKPLTALMALGIGCG